MMYVRFTRPKINCIGNVEVLKLISQKFKKYICLPAADGRSILNKKITVFTSIFCTHCFYRYNTCVPCRSTRAVGGTQVPR